MIARLNPLLDRWPLMALIASAAMLAVAHAFERFGGLAPCYLCLKQREVYWVAMAVGAAAIVAIRFRDDRRLRIAASALLAVIFAWGLYTAVYHAGAEWKFWPGPSVCAPSGPLNPGDLSALLKGGTFEMPSCDEPAWIFLGLSMAGWNAVASMALVVLSGLAVRRGLAKP